MKCPCIHNQPGFTELSTVIPDSAASGEQRQIHSVREKFDLGLRDTMVNEIFLMTVVEGKNQIGAA